MSSFAGAARFPWIRAFFFFFAPVAILILFQSCSSAKPEIKSAQLYPLYVIDPLGPANEGGRFLSLRLEIEDADTPLTGLELTHESSGIFWRIDLNESPGLRFPQDTRGVGDSGEEEAAEETRSTGSSSPEDESLRELFFPWLLVTGSDGFPSGSYVLELQDAAGQAYVYSFQFFPPGSATERELYRIADRLAPETAVSLGSFELLLRDDQPASGENFSGIYRRMDLSVTRPDSTRNSDPWRGAFLWGVPGGVPALILKGPF